MSDTLDIINTLVTSVGFSGTIAFLLLILCGSIITLFSKQLKVQSDSIKELANAVTLLTDKVSSPYLDVEKSLDIFRSKMNNSTYKKLNYIGEILERNSIHSREAQIKHNIENRFKQIVNNQAESLSKYKSVCGDMGVTLCDFYAWPEHLEPIYKIIFSEYEDHQKIKDIREYLNSAIDEIAKLIEDNGIHN